MSAPRCSASAAVAVFTLTGAAAPLAGQGLRAEVGAVGVYAQLRSEFPTGTTELRGSVLGGEGVLGWGPLLLEVQYVEGTVQPYAGTTTSREFVEGKAALGLRLFRWFTLLGGPHGRTYVTGRFAQRWAMWELRGRAEGDFIGSAVRGYAELWRAVASDVNIREAFGHAEGAEAGIRVRGPALRIRGRLAYRIERAVLGGGNRVETLDGVIIGLGVAWR